jgi:thiamine pyrophosphate-dependent acetolactate synthase large subunit-like protein
MSKERCVLLVSEVFESIQCAGIGATGLRIKRPEEIAPTLAKAFDTPGPVLIGVHVDYRDNIKLFEQVHEGSIF